MIFSCRIVAVSRKTGITRMFSSCFLIYYRKLGKGYICCASPSKVGARIRNRTHALVRLRPSETTTTNANYCHDSFVCYNICVPLHALSFLSPVCQLFNPPERSSGAYLVYCNGGYYHHSTVFTTIDERCPGCPCAKETGYISAKPHFLKAKQGHKVSMVF